LALIVFFLLLSFLLCSMAPHQLLLTICRSLQFQLLNLSVFGY
jgi:hypothetical protein